MIGSKEAIAHFPFAFVNPGDVVLCPDPGYPVYATLTRFAGGEPYFLPLRRENGFLPDLDAIPADVARRANTSGSTTPITRRPRWRRQGASRRWSPSPRRTT